MPCDRSRLSISLRLDGALSEFERAQLDRHLRRCSVCRSFARDAAAQTRALRSAPVEAVSVQLAPSVTTRRYGAGRLPAALALAGIAAAALFSLVSVEAHQPQRLATEPSAITSDAAPFPNDSLGVPRLAVRRTVATGGFMRGETGLASS